MPPGSPADDHDYPLVGETLGLWRLVRGVGRGGMGEVYEATYDFVSLLAQRYPAESRGAIERELRALPRTEQARLAGEMIGTTLGADASFAIKVCNARSGTAGHKRFLQEAEVAQRLGDHPYIVSVHAVNAGGLNLPGSNLAAFEFDRGRYRDVAFMVMDLSARTYDHTKLTIPQASHIVRCIALALDHAHAQGIVHRDLKPENLLGTPEYPLLTDFGIAKELDHSDGLTRTGQIIGTLDYMSPEQATDAKRVDHRSDIYSLGVVLYEMVTQGALPYYHKADRESCLSAIRSERVEPKWPRDHVSDCPVGIERIVLKAMAFRQEDRYQAMSEFITDLDRYARGEWISPFGRVKMRNWLRFQTRRHPRLVWGSAAAVLAMVALLVALVVMPLLDAQRSQLDEQLDHLTALVRQIEDGRLAQPGQGDQERIGDLDRNLRQVSDRYPDQVRRRADLEARLLARRWLAARFTGSDAAAARVQLTLAARLISPSWTLQDDLGLVMQEATRIPLGPYGHGGVRVLLLARTSEGFQMRVRDGEKLVRHEHLWRLAGGQIQYFSREDERPGQLLHQAPCDGAVAIEWEITQAGVRLIQPRQATFAVPGIADGAPAWLELTLPKDSALVALEIRPIMALTP